MSKKKFIHTYIVGRDGVTVYIQGRSYTVASGSSQYNDILTAIKKGKSEKKLLRLLDTEKAITNYCRGNVQINDGVLLYKGEELRNSITVKIVQMMEEGTTIDPMVNFLENLKENPSRTAQQELYDFLEAGDLPITPDGYFLAYKSVDSSYRDYHSGKFDNSIGAVCEMERGDVCDDRNITCSHGLHFAQYSYAKGFGTGGHLMVLKIDPADVVSIPRDYNNTKGRCSRYEVIAETSYDAGQGVEDKAVYTHPEIYVCEECGETLSEEEFNAGYCAYCGSEW